jgi:hypothetical protein
MFVGAAAPFVGFCGKCRQKGAFLSMQWKGAIAKTYTTRYGRIGLHVLFWLVLFGSNFYFNSISFNPFSASSAAYLLAGKSAALLALSYYVLMYGIRPRFLAKRTFVYGFILLLLLLLFYAALDAWGDKVIMAGCEGCMEALKGSSLAYYRFLQQPVHNIVLARLLSGGLLYQLLFQLSLPVALKIGRDYYRQAVQQLQLAKDNLQMEFNFLKAQVNPHFLFNTLNNLYSLVVQERKAQAAATIARLSGFMRYTLYETGEEKVLLEREIGLLKDYVELEKLRLNETVVAFQYEQDRDDYQIPPLLLMPALENAFKYSVDNRPDSHIHVAINARDGELHVAIKNNFDPEREVKKGGIGLQNLQKRLQHYYPGKSSCSATAMDGVYCFELRCTLL